MYFRDLSDRHRGKAASVGLFLAMACLASATSASAMVHTITFQGTVGSFVDVDNVYGFGAGADLSGDAVTDVYKVDPNNATFSSGAPYGPGSAFNAYTASFSGLNSATSTINGHTITFDSSNGISLTEYSQQLYLGQGSPPNPYNQSLIELQAIGYENTGSAIGSEFLIRDEAVSYSLGIPLSLSTTYNLTLASLNIGASAPGEASGVFFPYDPGATPGSFDLTLGTVAAAPEPSTWAMMILGFLGLGAMVRRRRAMQGA